MGTRESGRREFRAAVAMTGVATAQFAPHMVASFLGAMAACHVCASVPNFMILEWQTHFDTNPMYKELVTYDGPQVERGFITVSDAPGIGVEINEEGMRRHATPGVPCFA